MRISPSNFHISICSNIAFQSINIYVFPNITKTGWTSKKLADALLEEASVACLAGTAFGSFGEGYLRFSVANSLENLQKALKRVAEWAKKNVA